MAPALLRAASLALRASAAICPTTPTCPQDNQCSYVSGGVALQTATLTGCMKLCAATSNCVAVSYVDQNCYMSSTLNLGQSNENVVGASVVTRGPAPPPDNSGSPASCPTSYTCPENDGCTYTGGDGRTFALKSKADYYGGDFANMYSESLQSCNKACADNTQCIAASYTGDKGAGYCYVKDKNNGASHSDNVDDFALDTRVPASSTILPSSSSTAVSTASDIISSASSTGSSSSIISSSSSSSTPTPTPSSSTPSHTPSYSTPSSTPTPTPTPIPTPTPSKPTGPQLIANPSFEDGSGTAASPWAPNPTRNSASTAGRVNSDAHSGQYSYQASPKGNGQFTYWIEQPITVVVGQAYDVSVWVKASPEMSGCYVLTYVNKSRSATPVLNLNSSYQQFTVRCPATFFSDASKTFTVVVRCSGGGPSGRVNINDVTMTQVI